MGQVDQHQTLFPSPPLRSSRSVVAIQNPPLLFFSDREAKQRKIDYWLNSLFFPSAEQGGTR